MPVDHLAKKGIATETGIIFGDYHEEIEWLLCNGAGRSTFETQECTWMHFDPCIYNALNKEMNEQLQSPYHDKGMVTGVSNSSEMKVWVILKGKNVYQKTAGQEREESKVCVRGKSQI